MKTKPATEKAVLFCSEYCKRPTQHTFDHAVRVVDAAKRKDRVARDWFDLVFKCSVCGAKRVWGSEFSSLVPDENWLCTETRQGLSVDSEA